MKTKRRKIKKLKIYNNSKNQQINNQISDLDKELKNKKAIKENQIQITISDKIDLKAKKLIR